MTDQPEPHGEWPPEGIPILETPLHDGIDVTRAELLSFTPDWYEASPLVKEWVDELCELAGLDAMNVQQITVTFEVVERTPTRDATEHDG